MLDFHCIVAGARVSASRTRLVLSSEVRIGRTKAEGKADAKTANMRVKND